MRRGRGPRPLTLRPLHPAQVAHLERGGGHAARTRHYLYGKPAYCKLPHEVGMDAGFEARLQKLCLAQKADFKVVALTLPPTPTPTPTSTPTLTLIPTPTPSLTTSRSSRACRPSIARASCAPSPSRAMSYSSGCAGRGHPRCDDPLHPPRPASRLPHRHRRPAHPACPTSAADDTVAAALTHYTPACPCAIACPPPPSPLPGTMRLH